MLVYSTDVTDSEWELITSIQRDTRQRTHSLRQVWNAIFYLVKTGCQWRMLPVDFAPWPTVYYYYSRWRDIGLIEDVHQALYDKTRAAAGRDASPKEGHCFFDVGASDRSGIGIGSHGDLQMLIDAP